ncbi:hypothetical protein [Microvirga rosea]|uniref:hypothetical protein n=1 Tax=Microvirga rosea TaxID=2715425 RepID=UPI001D0B739B|nr:hypothetical protein [Microvirga rosea]MCB8821220.1 hypothetical protein [Microvirga rosea]
MTTLTGLPRAGQLDCVCAVASDDSPVAGRSTFLLATAFSLSVLAQILILGILPLAGLSLAPDHTWTSLPYAAFYAGAAVASLPASLLLDALGRRAAFSLGASLGIAGGLVLVWALVHWHFGALVLSAFWLGVAGGFSLFYRHAAAGLSGQGPRGTLLVFGAATLVGLVAPTLAGLAETMLSPLTFVGVAILAATAHIGSLVATAALPYGPERSFADEGATRTSFKDIRLPTLVGSLAWFLMTFLMGATPLAMVGCGLAEAVPGAIAWHVIAMYAPTLILATLPGRLGAARILSGGCAALLAGTLAFVLAGTVAGFSISTALVGIGWSLVTSGATLWIHRSGSPSRWALGLHDGSLLAGALLGALATSLFA